MESENTNEKKKQKVVLLIGLVTLLIAVLGATYAYFQINTNNESSNTNITGSTPPKSLVTLKQGTSNLHLNISASDMSLANAIKEYYGTDGEDPNVGTEDLGTKKIASVELTGGEETTKYSCTAKLTVSKVTEPDADKDTMIEVLQPGDMILQFKGNIISEKLDLSNLKENNPKEYDLSFKVTGNKVEEIQAYIKLLNKDEPQNYLAGKHLNIDISTSDLKCEVFIPNPKVAQLREDSNGTLSEDILGDMYRYQGTEVPNYVCFGTDNKNDECTNTPDDYMYRIIGITEEGELKIIKEDSIKENETDLTPKKYDYEVGDYSNYTCIEGNCDWNTSKLFKRINGLSNGIIEGNDGDTNIFLGTVEHPSSYEYLTEGTKWYNLIEKHLWPYGSLNHGYDPNNSDDINIEEVYKMENNLAKIDARIGLLYIYDYLYSVSGDNSSSWLNNNENSFWLINDYGDYEYAGRFSIYASYTLASDGISGDDSSSTSYNIYPIFYLNKDVKLKQDGNGTKINPYILDVQE